MPARRSTTLFLVIIVSGAGLSAAEAERSPVEAVGEALQKVATAADKTDFGKLLSLIASAGGDSGLKDDGLRLFYQGALIVVENICTDKGDDPDESEPLRLAFLAGRYAGVSQRHLHLMESSELPPKGFGARLAGESVASYYYLGRLMELEMELKPAERKTVHVVYFAAALRHWLGCDARRAADVAVVLGEWLNDLEKAGVTLSFEYLANLSTSPEMRGGRLPADAPLFYKVSEGIEDKILKTLRPTPVSIMTYVAAETYAYPVRYRWLEPAGLALEKLKVSRQELAGEDGEAFLDSVKGQLLQLRRNSKLEMPSTDSESTSGDIGNQPSQSSPATE